MMERGAPREDRAEGSVRLSYKFQRLREAIRSALLNGELPARLPGERELGRRFGANAKTINKALTDLAAEGLLVRRIGRGTFRAEAVRGAAQRRQGYAFCSGVDAQGGGTSLRNALLACAAGACWELQLIDAPSPAAGPASVIAPSDWPQGMRRATQALIFASERVLDHRSVLPSPELILEAHRRHVPMVALGASACDAKLHGVVPDFCDAGYRAAEHLYRIGCEYIVAICAANGAEGRIDHIEAARQSMTQAWHCGAVALPAAGANREIECLLNGCRTAATRFGGHMSILSLAAAGEFAARWSEAGRRATRPGAAPTGVITIGAAAREMAWRGGLAERWLAGEAAIVCVHDLAGPPADAPALTTYEFDAAAAAARALQVASSISAGQRPVELIVPGRLVIRETIAANTENARPSDGSMPGGLVRSPSAEVSI